MSDAETAAKAESPRHALRLPTHRLRRTISVTLVGALAFAASGAAISNAFLSPASVAIDDLVEPVATEYEPVDINAGKPINILVIGSDSREGENSDGSDVEGMRSDTTMIAHVSGDRSRIDIVSIPRDSLVSVPSCRLDRADKDRKTWEQSSAKFNSAFSLGGQTGDMGLALACTINTIHQNTEVPIHEFIMVDFSGFKSMVNAVGAVEIYTDRPLKDKRSGLNLKQGWVKLNGDQALAYTRARHLQGTDGSDIQRIDRQQQFVGALIRKALSRDVLTSPSALGGFMASVTASLMVSEGLDSGPEIVSLGWALRSIDPANIRFVTVPWADAGDKSSVVWTSEADKLWEQLRTDKPVSEILEMTDANGKIVPAPASTSDVDRAQQ